MFTSKKEISVFQLESIILFEHPHLKSLYVRYVSVNVIDNYYLK